ncbi:C4-dicarboxylate ABC transporter [Bacillus sp. M6-12]|nr:C4-dicarboxylate ABC transporter [Bacillus sp. M6-12]
MKDQIVIKFSHVVAENTPKGLAAIRFARLVDEYTNHRVRVEVYPNETLFSDANELEALRKNEVQMIAPATSKLTLVAPEWQLLDLPYIFPNYAALEESLTGEVGEELLQKLERDQLKGLAYWSNNFKQITSNTLIRTPADFKGKQFRIMPSEVLERQFEHFGASTSMLGFNDTFRNLEGHHLNSQENTISNINSKKLYQVQKYLTISDHGYLGYAVVVNKQFWDKIPDDIQEQVKKAMDETSNWLWSASQELNKEQFEHIRASSDISIYQLSKTEKKHWMKEMEFIYPEFEKQIGHDLLKKALEIRNKHVHH